MSLKCKECGKTFEDNDTYVQYNFLTAAEGDDSYAGDPCCPYCGSVELKDNAYGAFIDRYKESFLNSK
jgi:transposase-like protein